ncbi:uncharacterized protein LOC128727632 [Anopheles nili]|uniref:uncharacterized protein LOC128727632 n=1 Tax=Anopheles nili TaxID=185578 RepID=UPI00237B6875|nr:uncharacterized protein LOC128727632 [Anopheles nili]
MASFVNLQPCKKTSVGDVLRKNSVSPYSHKTSHEMGHYIREARKITRNNTFIGLETSKNDNVKHVGDLTDTLNRWSSAEHLSNDRKNDVACNPQSIKGLVEVSGSSIFQTFSECTNGSDSNDDDSNQLKENTLSDRRSSMIPLMIQPNIRQKTAISYSDNENLLAKRKIVLASKTLPKPKDSVKVYRTERMNERKMEMEQQFVELKEQIACNELRRQKDEQKTRDNIELMRNEIFDLKSILEKSEKSKKNHDIASDLLQEEYSLYSRSCEMSKRILTNTFRRKKKTNISRASCMQSNASNDQNTNCTLENDVQRLSNNASSLNETNVASEGGGDYNQLHPDTNSPINVVTSLYYVSKMQSVDMQNMAQEPDGASSLESIEKDLSLKKKPGIFKIGCWFKSTKH